MTSAIVLAFAHAAVAARRVDAASADARVVAAALVDVHFAEVAFVAGVRAVASEVVDAVDAPAAIQAGPLSAFVYVDLAMVSSEAIKALANVSLWKQSNIYLTNETSAQ